MEVLGGSGRVSGRIGRYLARDGSRGARVALALERPHAGVVVGKRGSGKSNTLAVLAEELADARGVAPVVVDPMGAFRGLEARGLDVVTPRVRVNALDPRAWCELLDLDPASAPGTLLWRAATEETTLDGMRAWVADADAAAPARRAAENHLALAAAWDCFHPNARPVTELLAGGAVLDCTALRGASLQAVVAAVGSAIYDAAVHDRADALPWLLIDEAHACASGPACEAVETLFTRGRAPGASVVLATQRPSALPAVAVSQADLVVAHTLTAESDIDALAAANPTYLESSLAERLPAGTGDAIVVDDTTEAACTVSIRERATAHGGQSARVKPSQPPQSSL
jgi:DNA helicase HerA-like ATPase